VFVFLVIIVITIKNSYGVGGLRILTLNVVNFMFIIIINITTIFLFITSISGENVTSFQFQICKKRQYVSKIFI
jgi:hypothetical protein